MSVASQIRCDIRVCLGLRCIMAKRLNELEFPILKCFIMILVAFESLFIRMYYTILIPSMASMTVDLLLVDYINYYESFRITIVH